MAIDPFIVSAGTFVGTALGALGLHLDNQRKERASKGLKVMLSEEDRTLIIKGHVLAERTLSATVATNEKLDGLHECINDVKDGLVDLKQSLLPTLAETGMAAHDRAEKLALAALEAQRLVAEAALKAQSVVIEQAVQRGIEQERARVAGGG